MGEWGTEADGARRQELICSHPRICTQDWQSDIRRAPFITLESFLVSFTPCCARTGARCPSSGHAVQRRQQNHGVN